MMSGHDELFHLRRAALEIFTEALASVDAARALRRAVRLDGAQLTVFDTTYNLETRRAGVYAIAIGKAAHRLAVALDEILGSLLTRGVIAGPSQGNALQEALTQQLIAAGQISEEEAATQKFRSVVRRASEQSEKGAKFSPPASFSSRWQLFEGGHPLPNRASLAAARASIDLLLRAELEGALVIFLISGGGSAMLEAPRDPRITLEDLREANRLLVGCGATIAEVNAVRRAFSAVKGGGLSSLAPRADQISLIVSDTNPGEEYAVASGPTFDPPADASEARKVVARYHLEKHLPASILHIINQKLAVDARASGGSLRKHYLLLDNQSAIEAAVDAALARGFTVEVAREVIEQPIEQGCAELLRILRARQRAKHRDEIFCLISGGEFACPVKGAGRGGRNAETALRCAIALHDEHKQSALNSIAGRVAVLSAGTDGTDGNSPAAGALADKTTVRRALARGLDAESYLERSDAYTFFNSLGDAITTGPTGTNVRDLRIMIAR